MGNVWELVIIIGCTVAGYFLVTRTGKDRR